MDILQKSIAYHDPDALWQVFDYRLQVDTELADSSIVKTVVEIDNGSAYFRYIQEEVNTDIAIRQDSCFAFDGNPIDCEATKTTRNYWLFLWGLPMKLMDEGTSVDSVFTEEKFEGVDCYKIRVPYAKDIWYFFIEKKTFALRGKTFYVDEERHLGEKMILTGEVNLDGLRLPKERKWVNTHDSLYVATDKLINFSKITSGN